MLPRPADEAASFVSPERFASLVARVEAADDPRAGIFGPHSIAWKINRESAVFLGAGRATLLQLAHPWVTAALAQHSRILQEPIRRFHHTFRTVYTIVFGNRGQAIAAAQRLYAFHVHIRGAMPHAVVAYPAGGRYEANELRALRWVFATLVDSAVLAYGFALTPLSETEREAYYQESKRMAALFGLGEEELPANWAEFAEYNRQMLDSNLLGTDESARFMAHRLLRGSDSWVVPPRWYRALTASWMPERFRSEFSLEFGPREEESLARARVRLPQVYACLPKTIRWVGPYREALARLHGGRPGWATRASTRFWTGEPRLMFPQNATEAEDAARSC
jgi:uncharacterized protein (DUF2236 family)